MMNENENYITANIERKENQQKRDPFKRLSSLIKGDIRGMGFLKVHGSHPIDDFGTTDMKSCVIRPAMKQRSV